jgi:hypothetical protein
MGAGVPSNPPALRIPPNPTASRHILILGTYRILPYPGISIRTYPTVSTAFHHIPSYRILLRPAMYVSSIPIGYMEKTFFN